MLLGQLEPLAGEVSLGASLKIGYFAQAHDALSGTHSVLDELDRHKEMLPEKARSYLAQYLFRGEDVFKPLDALSGGERARLALAILALEGANLLLLDEPTNHLDIPAREALQEVLDDFNGTILLVSHDRYLIDQLATQIWEIKGEKLNVFKGKYREYILRRTPASPGAAAPRIILKARPLERDNSKETRRRKQALDLLEERIREKETAMQRLSHQLQEAGKRSDFNQMHKISWQVAQTQAALESLMGEWEKLAEGAA